MNEWWKNIENIWWTIRIHVHSCYCTQVLSFEPRFQMSKNFIDTWKHFVTSSRIKHDQFFFFFYFCSFFSKFKNDFSWFCLLLVFLHRAKTTSNHSKWFSFHCTRVCICADLFCCCCCFFCYSLNEYNEEISIWKKTLTETAHISRSSTHSFRLWYRSVHEIHTPNRIWIKLWIARSVYTILCTQLYTNSFFRLHSFFLFLESLSFTL